MITLLLADDHPLYRDALRGAIQQSMANVSIVEASNLDETLDKVSQHNIDLLLLDLHMPGSNDLFGLIHIRKIHPDLPVAVVSGLEDINIVSKVLNTGALGFIPKTASATAIGLALSAMLEGDTWVPDNFVETLNGTDNEFSALADKVSSLTPAQYKVLCLMRDGLLNKQIGYELDIAEATVKAHVTAIFKKLGINNRTQGVLIASQLQLSPPTN